MMCPTRSAALGRPVEHLYNSKMRRAGVETIHCSWCWRVKP